MVSHTQPAAQLHTLKQRTTPVHLVGVQATHTAQEHCGLLDILRTDMNLAVNYVDVIICTKD